MTAWKYLLRRVALSTASLTIIAALGGFLGGLGGAIVELVLHAIAGITVPPLELIPSSVVLGMSVSLIWGLSVLVENWPGAAGATSVASRR
ncbi:MAG TPA: hypothetical protein VM536_03030 [Chloroflexia bacterium]|nr:hypothetical protein [Chloroflexia bacterium]